MTLAEIVAAQLGVPLADVQRVERLRYTSRPILVPRAAEIEAALATTEKEYGHA